MYPPIRPTNQSAGTASGTSARAAFAQSTSFCTAGAPLTPIAPTICPFTLMVQLSGVVSSGNECVEEEVKCGDPAIASDDEVGSGIGRRLARAARHPSDATG